MPHSAGVVVMPSRGPRHGCPPPTQKHKHSVERAIVAMSDFRTVAVESKRLERECDTLATADAQRDYAAL